MLAQASTPPLAAAHRSFPHMRPTLSGGGGEGAVEVTAAAAGGGYAGSGGPGGRGEAKREVKTGVEAEVGRPGPGLGVQDWAGVEAQHRLPPRADIAGKSHAARVTRSQQRQHRAHSDAPWR